MYLDFCRRFLLLHLQLGNHLLCIANRLFGAQDFQIVSRNIQPYIVAGFLYGEQRRPKVELGAFKIVHVPQAAEYGYVRPYGSAVTADGLLLDELVSRRVEHTARRKRIAARR